MQQRIAAKRPKANKKNDALGDDSARGERSKTILMLAHNSSRSTLLLQTMHTQYFLLLHTKLLSFAKIFFTQLPSRYYSYIVLHSQICCTLPTIFCPKKKEAFLLQELCKAKITQFQLQFTRYEAIAGGQSTVNNLV